MWGSMEFGTASSQAGPGNKAGMDVDALVPGKDGGGAHERGHDLASIWADTDLWDRLANSFFFFALATLSTSGAQRTRTFLFKGAGST